jgi:uncharacterized damage-inducible protein DinB
VADEILLELFRHNAWANVTLIRFCAGLTEHQLSATDSATYSDTRSTFQHVLGSEAYYWSLFSGQFPVWSRPDSEEASVEEMLVWAENMGELWSTLFQSPLPEWVNRRRPDGSEQSTAAAIVLTQALHHGNVHREQISHLLTVAGIEPPDISGWCFSRESAPAPTS